MSSPRICRQRSIIAGIFRPAFTLVELLIVIGIIGILIAATITVIAKVQKAAYGASTSAQLSAISNVIQMYYGDFHAYPGPLSNSQLGSAYAPTASQGIAFIPGPINLTAKPGNKQNITFSNTTLLHISGTQNLTLGLLGGLEVQTIPSVAFYYNPDDIFPDGKAPAPVGASSLSPTNPRRQQAYIQVRPGDLSIPSMAYNMGAGASFADAAGRSPMDAPIPVFLDKYPDAMPILYIRTNPGALAVAGIRNTDGSSALVDPQVTGGPTLSPQYDLCQILDYTKANSNSIAAKSGSFGGGFIGVNYTGKAPYHGLQGLGNQSINPSGGTIDTIDSGYANQGNNGVAYFRDPAFKADMNSSYNPLADNRHAGIARNKDSFTLITAGPDRAYGTSDDLIFPGSLSQ